MASSRARPSKRSTQGLWLLSLIGCAGAQAGPNTGTAPISTSTSGPQLTVEAWRADLRTLALEVQRKHANAFHQVSSHAFATEVQRVDARIAEIDGNSVLVEFLRLVALIGDGHTRLVAPPAARLALHSYGLRFGEFQEGLFIIAADGPSAHLLGSRVLRMGSVPVEEILARVVAISPGDNEHDRRYRALFYLRVPEIIAGLGVTHEPAGLEIEVESTTGTRRKSILKPSSEPPCFPRLPCSRDRSVPSGWTDVIESWASPIPRDSGRDDTTQFRSVPLNRGGVLYVEFKAILDSPDETIEAFCRRTVAENADAQSLILDLRRNHGPIGGISPLFGAG